MSDCFVLYLLLTCMKKKTSGADKFTNNTKEELLDKIKNIDWDSTKPEENKIGGRFNFLV